MAEIRKPAIKITQGRQSLFILSLTVRDLMLDNFYRVDALDVREGTGTQRLLKTPRAKALCRDIMEMEENNEEFLPTSVFFATQGEINYDEDTKELFFNTEPSARVCPLDVVDGQHRLRGLELAVQTSKDKERKKNFLNFPIIVAIAPKMNEIRRRLQFITVNTKQEPVNRGVKEAMIAQFTHDIDRYSETTNDFWLPSWIAKKAEVGKEQRAINIAIKLNDAEDSPWYQRIQLASENKNERHIILQQTFCRSVSQFLLSPSHPIHNPSFNETKKFVILNNFWKAVDELCVEHDDDVDSRAGSVVFKNAGLDFFHGIFSYILLLLANNRQYQVEVIKDCMTSAEEYLPPEWEDILTPKYWKKGNREGASGLTKGTIASATAAFYKALQEAHTPDES